MTSPLPHSLIEECNLGCAIKDHIHEHILLGSLPASLEALNKIPYYCTPHVVLLEYIAQENEMKVPIAQAVLVLPCHKRWLDRRVGIRFSRSKEELVQLVHMEVEDSRRLDGLALVSKKCNKKSNDWKQYNGEETKSKVWKLWIVWKIAMRWIR